MGKSIYADVIGNLKPLPDDDPKYREKVDRRKAEICETESQHIADVVRAVVNLRERKNDLEKLLKELNLDLSAYTELLVDQYEAADITSMKLTDGGSLRVQFEPYARVNDKDALRQWAIREGLESEMSLQWQTTNRHTKEALLDNQPIPDGVEAFYITKLVYTKG